MSMVIKAVVEGQMVIGKEVVVWSVSFGVRERVRS